MDLSDAIAISAAGMKAQGTRMKVIAENVANAQSTGETPGDLPYRRKVVTFRNELDRETDTRLVRVAQIGVDDSDFKRRFDPNHPSADADGYVLMPNVNSLVEVMDMRQAQRSYEANLSVIDSVRRMVSQTIDLLRA